MSTSRNQPTSGYNGKKRDSQNISPMYMKGIKNKQTQ